MSPATKRSPKCVLAVPTSRTSRFWFSGSLSGVPHPRSVTRHNHGKTIPYHRKLIGQKFERCVALTSDQKKNHESPHIGLISDWYHGLPRVVARISSRITTVIRVVGTIEETIAVLPSHSQFRRKNYLYLHLHGLVLETSIYHWQDQPGSRRDQKRGVDSPQPFLGDFIFSGTTKPHKNLPKKVRATDFQRRRIELDDCQRRRGREISKSKIN